MTATTAITTATTTREQNNPYVMHWCLLYPAATGGDAQHVWPGIELFCYFQFPVVRTPAFLISWTSRRLAVGIGIKISIHLPSLPSSNKRRVLHPTTLWQNLGETLPRSHTPPLTARLPLLLIPRGAGREARIQAMHGVGKTGASQHGCQESRRRSARR